MDEQDIESIREKILELDISDQEKEEAIEYFCNFESLTELLSLDPWKIVNRTNGMIFFFLKEHLERWRTLLHPSTSQYLQVVDGLVDFIRWDEPLDDFEIDEETYHRIEEVWESLLERNDLPYNNTNHEGAQEIVMYLVSSLFRNLKLGERGLIILEDKNDHSVGGILYPDISIVAELPYIDIEVKPEINRKIAKEALEAGLPLALPTNSKIPKSRRSYGNAKKGLSQLFSRFAQFMNNADHPLSNFGIIADGKNWMFFFLNGRKLTCHYSQLYEFYWDEEIPQSFIILAKMMLKALEMKGNALSNPLFFEFPHKRIHRQIKVATDQGEKTLVLLHEVHSSKNSDVYIARDEQSRKISILKVYHSVDQYENESRTLPLLSDCVGVPEMEFMGRYNGSPVISIFPLGSSLQEIMARKVLSNDEVVDTGFCLFRILESIHDKGVVHGDIKPENLLITPDNRLFLIDYGSSYLAEEGCRKPITTDLFSPRMVNAFGFYPGMNGDLESAYFTINYLLDRTLSWANGGKKPSLEILTASNPELEPINRYLMDRMGDSFSKLNPVSIYSYQTNCKSE
eukprot:TRINITY_DN2037_c0_g1_i1.p1 TRINITY_DN2037_c0_g1~~TRINITY_DN2037_c0_g1_i1.p1  ORF type:complete len:571 (+),score=111.29 TRINITY_DN2037_c0_g1_i1:223-1935(+)